MSHFPFITLVIFGRTGHLFHHCGVLKTLVISSDTDLVFHLDSALRKLEFEMDLKPTVSAGMDKMRYERYNAVVVDSAAGTLTEVARNRDQWLKTDPTVIVVGRESTNSLDGVHGAHTVWTLPLVPWEVYRTLLNVRTQATGDRRLRKRFTLNRPAPFRYNVAGAQHEAVIIDVTETGIAIEGVQALPNGITVPVEFKLPAMLSPISTVAEVVWRNDRRAGLRFLQLQPQQQRQLERWLQHSRQGMTTGYSYASGY